MKKTNIAINASYIHENPTGLGVYTYELLVEILNQESPFNFMVFTSSKELKDAYPDNVILTNHYTSPALGTKGHLMRFLWQQTALPISLRINKAHLLHSTVPEGILRPGQKQIITIHDIIPLKYHDLHPRMKYYYQHILPILIRNTHTIICVSEHTKKDLYAHYDIKDKPVHVIHEGLNRNKFSIKKNGFIQKKYGANKYLLYIGDMRPYKNIIKSLEAFARLRQKNTFFIIAGKKDPRFFPEIKKKVVELSLGNRVLFPGYVADEEIPSGAGLF